MGEMGSEISNEFKAASRDVIEPSRAEFEDFKTGSFMS
jgi:hypothetical protein